jgi:ubiquinone/menaquinone biosynthesis C-methylase UbiE
LDGELINRATVVGHYSHSDLLAAIEAGLALAGKTTATVTVDDLAPVDEFHIGGRTATEDLVAQLHLSAGDRVLDIGCGLGGAARYIADRHGCRVTGIDLTPDYLAAGNRLCEWVGLASRVSLQRANALLMPFPDGAFDAAYMLHVGMNIADKAALFSEAARVLRPGAPIGIYDVMRIGEGEVRYPLPWATTTEANAVADPAQYRKALVAAGFEILSERDRREFALRYFEQQRAKVSAKGGPPPLGLHTLMGDRRREQVMNMIENVVSGRLAPIEIVARKA